MRFVTLLTLALAGAMATPASADSYVQGNFSGGTFGGNANVQSPFSGNGFFPSQTFTGSFVYDSDLVPGAGSGFVSVFPSSFPDAALIPDSAQFSFNFGPLVFTPSGADLFAIQYNNGAFNGFAYVDTFSFQGGTYQLSIQGGTLAVYEVIGGQPGFTSLVNGYINIGNAAVTGQTAFEVAATPAVPEPGTWALMLLGFGGIGVVIRRRSPRHLAQVA
jgi:hypothetical protein